MEATKVKSANVIEFPTSQVDFFKMSSTNLSALWMACSLSLVGTSLLKIHSFCKIKLKSSNLNHGSTANILYTCIVIKISRVHKVFFSTYCWEVSRNLCKSIFNGFFTVSSMNKLLKIKLFFYFFIKTIT